MFSVKQEIQSSTAFHGVRFALFGFDPLEQDEVRSKLVSCGAVDVGQYRADCTHVIVDKIVYDDPVCVAARRDGKKLVNSHWVQHSLDVGSPLEVSLILYRPVKDLKGIPGAENLILCLTGYLRNDREDVMLMASLMGAQFSKPLHPTRVTHLVCFKFEGDKYYLAKKTGTIKLVNHRWLEDCLKAWKLLPEENYSRSGYEVDMEAEAAKDSEDEAEDIDVRSSIRRNSRTSPPGIQNKAPGNRGSPLLVQRALHVNQAEELSNRMATNNEECGPDQALNSAHVTQVHQQAANCSGPNAQNVTVSSPKKNLLPSSSGSKKSVDSTGSKFGKLSYSRKTSGTSGLPLDSAKVGGSANCCLSEPRREDLASEALDGALAREHEVGEQSLHDQGSKDLLSYRRKMDAYSDISPGGLKSQRLGSSSSKTMNATNASRREDLANEAVDGALAREHEAGKQSLPDQGSKDLLSHKRRMEAYTDMSPGSLISQKLGSSSSKATNATDASRGEDLGKQSLQDQGSKGLLSYKRKMDAHSDIGSLKSRNLGSSSNKTTNAVDASNGTSKSSSIDHPNSHLEETSVPQSISKISDESLGSKEKLQEHVTDVSAALTSGTPDGSKSRNDEAENQQQGVDATSAEKAQFSSKPNQAFSAGKSSSKSPRKKSVGKKTLGSRPRTKMGSSANQKGSICLSVTPGFDSPLQQNGDIPSASVKSADANNPEMPDLQAGGSIIQKNDTTGNTTNTVDGETEAPPELETTENNGQRKEDEQPHLSDIDASMKENPENGVDVTKKSTKRKKAVASKGRKRPKSSVLGVLEPNVMADRAKDEGIQSNKKKGPSNSTNDADKENKEVHNDKNTSDSAKGVGKSTKQSIKTKMSSGLKKAVVVAERGEAVRVEKQPGWFILSGHRLQRKEFQKMVRRLKGRLCRDSHHWSYQATHFIVPDPVRRTEKFFAAAASGSWILKSDYLTASDQAGKLLPEEPYEWHKVGLSEDGAINLEAPRKWRLLKERTGHGAFYGMRVIIYGECIAPPLDTLKRVVKAGDGVVLATAPPYTRFLNSGVDFAIVSPGMPRVDVWVQEFLRHKIPCVLSDYLVEYVCKPGYSLDKHVQYNTHDWAATSSSSLASRLEEIVLMPEDRPSTSADNDISCRVCGSTDRGDVMLICGDVSGATGCGAGAHIDCCDPPLEKVPEGDWFCPECSSPAETKTAKKGSKSKRR